MNIKKVASAFFAEDIICSVAPFGGGLINETFMITTREGGRYILQHINKNVFKNPVAVMENACGVTEFIRNKGGVALSFLRTPDGKACYEDESGEFWRAYDFVEGLSMDVPESDEDFYQSGLAFGGFQHMLSDYPAATLHETIPNFHNTPDRYRQFHETLAADPAGRKETALPEIEFYLSQEERGGRLYAMLQRGVLPLRVTHNDTKLNNVLLDPETHAPLCVLDLDTVMPGLSAYDFGDSIRTGAATVAEDDQDTSKMKLDLHLFEIFTRGFMHGAPSLTEAEVKALPLGAFVMTLECGVRFLKDYLDGDIYFRTGYPTHNLVRCRSQMALCIDMLAHWAEMEAIVEKVEKEIC